MPDQNAATKETRQPPERLFDLGQGLALWRAHIDDLHEQEINARVQPPAMFDRLKTTIGRDARLESLPFCALVSQDPVRIEIVSGHHRSRAARAAGLDYIYAIVDETGLSRDQIAAKQLAHNSIAGHDEGQLIARIYQQIADVDARLESYIAHEEGMETPPPPVQLPKLDLTIDYRTVLITFLPHQAELFMRAVEQLVTQADLNRDELLLVDLALFDQWKAATSRLGKEYGARAASTVVARMVDAVAEVLGIDGRDPADLDPYSHVPLTDLLGTAVVAPDLAAIVDAVATDAVRKKQVTKAGRVQVLEWAFQEYAERHGITLPSTEPVSA
jgi:hypothetical protein